MPKLIPKDDPEPLSEPVVEEEGRYGLNIANQFRPVEFNKGVRKQVKYREADDPAAYSGLIDSYRDNYMGATVGFIEKTLAGGKGPAGWDPLDHIPEGYDQFIDAFINVENPEQMDVVRRHIDNNLATRGRREARGFGSTFASDFVAGVFDPSNLIGMPALKGLGFLRGAATGATINATLGAAQETTVVALDPAMQPGEGRARILGGLLGGAGFGGLLGGGAGMIGRKAALAGGTAGAGAGPRNVRIRGATITTERSFEHMLMVLEGGGVLVDNKEGAGLTKYGITQRAFPNENIAALTKDRAIELAKKHYWLPEFDKVNSALAAVALDAYYISGNKKLVRAILASGDAGAGIRIYRGHLDRLSTVSSKHRKFKKGWNNRVDKLVTFLGGEPQRGRYAFDTPSGPGRVAFGSAGYYAVKQGRTGIYDSNGRYVPAGLIRGVAHVTDEHTTAPVPERPELYETVAEKTETHANTTTTSSPQQYPEVDPELSNVINRPAVRAADPEAPNIPRPVNSPKDAAIELDRLENGDAAAARQIVNNEITGPEGDNLPFVVEQAAKQMPPDEVAFLTDVLEAKGLLGMSQPELNKLYPMIVRWSESHPEAAKLFMGKDYDGRLLKRSEVKKRIDNLIVRRTELAEKAAGIYERNIEPEGKDVSRDNLDLAEDQTTHEISTVEDQIDTLVKERDNFIKTELENSGAEDPDMVGALISSWRREYADKIALKWEFRAKLVARMRNIKAERKRLFGQAINEGEVGHSWEMLADLTVADRKRVLGKGVSDSRAGGLASDSDELAQLMDEVEPPDDLKKIWAHDKKLQRLAEFTNGQLRVTIQDVQDQIMKLTKDASRYVGRGETVVVFNKKQQSLFNRLTRQMHDYQNRLYEMEEMDRQIGDLLPFTLPGNPNTQSRIPTSNEPYIAIDVDAILGSFKNKPWTQAVHGLPGMDEDAFSTPEQWLNFVYFHEKEHLLNKRIDGESLGDYETRINGRAYDAAMGHDAPWKPVDGWAAETVLRPTPIGQLMQLVKNPSNYIWESIARLASDFDLRLQRNIVPGGASVAGGSVFQRVMQHQARGAEYYNALENAYLKYARGRASDSGATMRAAATWRESRRAHKQEKITFDEFDKRVGRAQATGIPDKLDEVNEAANLFNSIVKDMRRQEEAAGLLPSREALEQELKDVTRNLSELTDRQGGRTPSPKTAAIMKRWIGKIEDLNKKLETDVSVPGKKGLPYFTRIWNVDAMKANPDPLILKFTQMFVKDGHSPESAATHAQQLFDNLIEDPASQSIHAAALPGELRSRDLPIENDEVIDYIQQSSSIILNRYMKRNGGALEMKKMFGDASGDMEQDRVLAALEAEGLAEDEIFAAMQIWQDARDRILGAFHGENPGSFSNRAVRFAKRWTRFAVMGMTGISQITDAVRAAHVVGPKSFAKGMFAPLYAQMEGYDPDIYSSFVGEALDVEMGLALRRMMDDDDWTMRASESGLEKMMGDIEVPFFILNGTTPFTKLFKKAVARAVPHITLDRAKKVAAAIRAGKAVPQEEATWLREHGVDEHDAMVLADMPVHTSPSGWMTILPEDWEAVGPKGSHGLALLKGVISGNVRRGVSTPGPLNRPRIMDGILINKKERKRAWEDRWAAEQAEEDARQNVIKMREAGIDDSSPEFREALNQLGKATGAHTTARLNTGIRGRKEHPMASLPLQLQSFAFSQTSKLLHSMLSGRDKQVMVGVLSLWAAGIVSGYLKGLPLLGGSNEHATWDEHLMRGFTSSGLLAWMTIPLEAAKGLSRMAIGEVKLGDSTLIERDRQGLADNAGVFGPTISSAMGFFEGAFGKGLDGQDLEPSERVYQLRKVLPFGTMIYFNWMVRKATGLIAENVDGDPEPQNIAPDDDYTPFQEGMLGFTYGDEDPRSGVPTVADTSKVAAERLMTSEELLASFEAQQQRKLKKAKGKKPKLPSAKLDLNMAVPADELVIEP